MITFTLNLLCSPRRLLALAAVSLTGLFLQAAEAPPYSPEAGSTIERQTSLRWSFRPNPNLPNVLILGDSISMGYTLPVRRLLASKANVARPLRPDGQPVNCLGTTAGLKSIDSWLAGHHWSVIHFNFGLHDLKHVNAKTGNNSDNPADPPQATPEQYGRNLEAIVARLKETGAHLIFATTTPIAPGTVQPVRDPEAAIRYNAVALRIMAREGIQVDDLYSLCQPRLAELQLPHNVHFTAAGWNVLAHQVAATIAGALPENTAGRPTRVACVGDSITAGAGTKNRALESYPAQLQRMLTRDHWWVGNFGVGGATLLTRGDKPYVRQAAYRDALASRPDVVVIMLGTNDSKPQNWSHAQDFQPDYLALIRRFQALSSHPRIFVCDPILVAGSNPYGIRQAEVMQELPQIDAVARETGAMIIDLQTVLRGHESVLRDHVHPNADGARLLAATVYRTLTGSPFTGPLAPAKPE